MGFSLVCIYCLFAAFTMVGVSRWPRLRYSTATTIFLALFIGSLWVRFIKLHAAILIGLVLVMLIERKFPREKNQRPDETIRNYVYVLFRLTARPVVFLTGIALFSSWQPDWGLSNQDCSLWLQIPLAFVIFDLFNYFYHRSQHRFSYWWKFHRVHHATEHLNAVAFARTQLLEVIFIHGLSNLILATALGFDPDALLYGVFVPRAFLEKAWAHANFDFPKKRQSFIASLLISPNAHALHHTKQFDNCNFGSILMIWDRIFGTYQPPEKLNLSVQSFGVADWSAPESLFAEQFDFSTSPRKN